MVLLKLIFCKDRLAFVVVVVQEKLSISCMIGYKALINKIAL